MLSRNLSIIILIYLVSIIINVLSSYLGIYQWLSEYLNANNYNIITFSVKTYVTYGSPELDICARITSMEIGYGC